MSIMRFRLLGNRADVDEVIAALEGLDRIDHVEELDILAPTMRDDSSSSKLTDDSEGHSYVVEVDAPDDEVADQVREVAEACTAARSAGIEFLDDF